MAHELFFVFADGRELRHPLFVNENMARGARTAAAADRFDIEIVVAQVLHDRGADLAFDRMPLAGTVCDVDDGHS